MDYSKLAEQLMKIYTNAPKPRINKKLENYSRGEIFGFVGPDGAGNMTIFLTTHYMELAEVCTCIAVMKNGQITEIDAPTNLKNLHEHVSGYFLQ